MIKLKDYKPTDKGHFTEVPMNKEDAKVIIELVDSIEAFKNACREFKKINSDYPKINKMCDTGITHIDEWFELLSMAMVIEKGKKVSVQ